MISKFVLNRLMIAALESESLNCDFEIISNTFEDDHSASYAAEYVAGILGRTDTDNEPFDCLELKTYRATDDSGDCITDALITCGGPYAAARYESRTDTVAVTFKWGADCLVVQSGNAPICEVLKAISEY